MTDVIFHPGAKEHNRGNLETLPMEKKMKEEARTITDPPGGVLVWFVIFMELVTFIAGIFFYFSYRADNRALFAEMQQKLNLTFGILNTIFLVSSGYFVAIALEKLKHLQREESRRFLVAGILLGCCFIGLKTFEYHEKIAQGLTTHLNLFFNFYWFLTFFHYMHVIFATIILIVIYFKISEQNESEVATMEVGASLWHMCDLIWILLFPTLFFIR